MSRSQSAKVLLAVSSVALVVLGLASPPASAAPAWDIEVVAADRVDPGSTYSYWITPRNVGDDDTDGTGILDVTLPDGVKGVSINGNNFGFPLLWKCSDPNGASNLHCVVGDPFVVPLAPGETDLGSPLVFQVEADQSVTGSRAAHFQMSGGGAPTGAETTRSVNFSATPDFGISRWDGHIPPAGSGGSDEAEVLQAGSHPADIVTTFEMNSLGFGALGSLSPDAGLRNVLVDLPSGFVGAPTALPTCKAKDLAPEAGGVGDFAAPQCAPSTVVGVIEVLAAADGSLGGGIQPWGAGVEIVPIFNMKPPLGGAPRFGFNVASFPQEISATARTDGNLDIQIRSLNTSQGLSVLGAKTTFWGVPADPVHDSQRCQVYDIAGQCAGAPHDPAFGPNPAIVEEVKPFLTLPTSCSEGGKGLRFDLFAESWEQPSSSDSAFFETTVDPPADNTPVGTSGCDRVPFQPELTVQPTTDEAETPTGIEVALRIPPDGLNNPTGISQSHLKDATVTLPEGMTVNPSQANGLAVCTPSQIGLTSGDGKTIRFNAAKPSCPEASQLGEVRIDTPLIDDPLLGSVHIAQQDDSSAAGVENPFNSTLALYIVAEGSEQLVKLAGEVAPDPRTGQIVTKFLNNPQVPFERFALKFKGGQRAALSMPPTCGVHTTEAELSPWARPDRPVTVTDSFNVTKGPNGGPCPAGGVPPFKPGFTAGTLNNNAGSYSPFVMRLTRADGEQDMTKFSAILPPGVVGKLAGVSKCSEDQIALAKSRGDSGEGKQEIASPSCPASSQIGRIEAGAGVGSIQVYVPGKVYLAGPYNGAPLSVVVVTPAVAGPFDLGNVVVREALDLNPKTAEVEVDGDASDPIPHILRGIPLRLRDLRVFVDKDNFILNPTSCDPSATKATLFGSFLDVLSPSDDVPVALEDRFQAANCANLGFKPKLNLTLTGGTKRGGHPGLKAVYKPRPGDANVSGVTVRLPRSAFLDQAHIRTICTRVQFAAENCPPAAQYGYIKAFTPLLDEPLQGPVWLRSSNNKLPDLVFDLQGIVDVEVATRIDSVRGGIRANVETAPDAPLSKVVLTMQGGKKGLIVNSTNLCKGTNRGEVNLTGHNGKTYEARPVVRPVGCGKGRKAKRGARR